MRFQAMSKSSSTITSVLLTDVQWGTVKNALKAYGATEVLALIDKQVVIIDEVLTNTKLIGELANRSRYERITHIRKVLNVTFLKASRIEAMLSEGTANE